MRRRDKVNLKGLTRLGALAYMQQEGHPYSALIYADISGLDHLADAEFGLRPLEDLDEETIEELEEFFSPEDDEDWDEDEEYDEPGALADLLEGHEFRFYFN